MPAQQKPFVNPYRPGAGHMPPFLAGRHKETAEFECLLSQEAILENMVLTGLRGVGKTVLLDTFKPTAIASDWRWVGTDLSESATLTEANIAIRLLADLSAVSSALVVRTETTGIGFASKGEEKPVTLDYGYLTQFFNGTPGLVSDKLKGTLEYVWSFLKHQPTRGLVFAYDEAQNLTDHAEKDQFPLSLLLDTFQSIQKKGIPFMLVLTGLPTLFPKLVEARTFAERMFRVVFLDRLTDGESEEAIVKPVQKNKCPVSLQPESVQTIVSVSAGYPYFIQFICREVYDIFLQQFSKGETATVPVATILAKLDTDFFAGRWSRATDRQRELLRAVASLENCDAEFTVQEVVEQSKKLLEKPFSSSHTNQMLASLSNAGLVFKNRHGKYSFAVPLMGQFIKRQYSELVDETAQQSDAANPDSAGAPSE